MMHAMTATARITWTAMPPTIPAIKATLGSLFLGGDSGGATAGREPVVVFAIGANVSGGGLLRGMAGSSCKTHTLITSNIHISR